MAVPQPGTTLDRYHLHEKIGQGGMGSVYRAEDTRLGRMVALKFLGSSLAESPQGGERLDIEARAAAKLSHPNVCTVYEIAEWEGEPYIAMELVEGRSLSELLRDGPLPIDQVRSIASQVADGLAAAHEAGILHRDVKAANVIVTESGLTKLVDFGLAKTPDRSLTDSGQILGTFEYMSPELIDGGDVGPTSDVWSFGVLLYEMIAGQRPFTASQVPGTMYKILSEPPPPLDGEVPDDLVTVIDRCLDKDPTGRFPSMAHAAAELRGATAPSFVFTPRPAPKDTSSSRRLTRVAGAVAAVVALVLGGQWAFGARPLPGTIQLAVLPFAATQGLDSAFVGGLAESLVSRLASVEPLNGAFAVIVDGSLDGRVITDPAEAGSLLGASVALTASFTREGDAVQSEIRLVDAASGRRLRRATTTGTITDPEGLQDSLAVRAADLLGLRSDPTSQLLLRAGDAASRAAPDLFLQGTEYLQRWQQPGQVDVALSMFEESLQADPTFALAHAGLAEAQLKKYQLTRDTTWAHRAESESDRAIELMGEDIIGPYLTLGQIHVETGAYGRALTAFTYVINREPGSSAAYVGRAKALEELGRLDDAERDLRSAIVLNRRHWEGHSRLGSFLFRRGRVEEAADLFTDVTRLAPDYAGGYRSLGGALFYLDRLDEAEAAFDRALALAPSYTVYMNLATVLYFQEEFGRAADTYREALALNESDYLTWSYLATSEYLSGNEDEAMAAWREMVQRAEARLSVNPRDARAKSNVAFARGRLGEEDVARALLDEIVAEAPSDRTVTYTLALTYESLGERTIALEWLRVSFAQGQTPDAVVRDPWMTELRNSPEYEELLQQVGPADDR